MAKKNRNKNKKKKKEKESDGTTGNVNGGSNNNDNNNDITIPSMGATRTTTTIVLTSKEIERIDITFKLKGYPKSTDFLIGYRQLSSDQKDPAIASIKHGAQNDGCVPCLFCYANIQRQGGNWYLVLPFALEGAIRGHVGCMNLLISFYEKLKTVPAMALSSLWAKMKIELGNTFITEEKRKQIKKIDAQECFICRKKDLEDNDVTLVKCGTCKYYSYCGKNCQTRHWQEGKHMNECRQVILLRKYCKPSYVKEIRKAIIDGQDPKDIHTLQRLRMKLGLNRPKEEYEELMLRLNNDNNNTMKPGTTVIVKRLVNAFKHNGKVGIVTKVLPSAAGEEWGRRRVGVKLLDSSGTVLNIKIENLQSIVTMNNGSNPCNSNRPDPLEYLVGRKDGTVHIGSTPNDI